MSSNHVQDVIVHSKALDSRRVHCPATVEKHTFCRDFKSTKRKSFRHIHDSNSHKLPEEWSRILHPNKVWATLSEDVTQRAAAAWHWLHTFVRGQEDGSLQAGVQIETAQFSKLASPCILMERAVGDAVVASLGNAVWGALVWPMQRVTLNDGAAAFMFSRMGPVTWLHIVNPSDWHVLPWKAARHCDHGVLLEQCGDPISLLRHGLGNKNSLHCDDLLMCAKHLGIEVKEQDTSDAKAIIDLLCRHIAPDDQTYVEAVQKCWGDTGISTEEALLKDPNWNLTEAAFEDMDPEDKGGFPEMRKAVKRKKEKHAGLGEQAKRRKRFFSGVQPKARGKSEGEGQSSTERTT